MLNKLKSRKFIASLIGEAAGIITLVTGIVAAIVGEGHPAVVIVGAALTVVASVGYMIIEGRLDEKSITAAGNAAADIAEAAGNDKAADAIEDITEEVSDFLKQ